MSTFEYLFNKSLSLAVELIVLTTNKYFFIVPG